MATAQLPTVQCLILDNVDWRMYSQLLRAFAERPGIRLTYDRGTLEIMSPLLAHDGDADFLGMLVRALAAGMKIPIKGSGSTTLRRRKKQKGLEPDRGFWIANEAAMRGKRHYSPKTDPPPDLAIEVDVTNSSLNRMSIYASLGVPEVWRLDGQTLTFHVLDAGRTFVSATNSKSFPGLTSADLMHFMGLRATVDETTIGDQFRTWVEQREAANWQ